MEQITRLRTELKRALELLEHIERTPAYGSDQNSRAELREHIESARDALSTRA